MIIHSAGGLTHSMPHHIASARTPVATDPPNAPADSPHPGAVPAQSAAQTQSASPAKESETERLLKTLRDYIDKGPIVALREKLLKSMNLTEEKLKALPPEQQNAIETEIARKIKEFLLEQQEAAHHQPAPTHAQTRLIAYQTLPDAPK